MTTSYPSNEKDMNYYALRNILTGEVESVYRCKDGFIGIPGVRVYSLYDYGYKKPFKAEAIVREEFETLLTFHGIDIEKFLEDDKINFTLFTLSHPD